VGLGEGIVALVELVVSGLLVPVGSEGEELPPSALVLAVCECKQAVLA